MARAPLGAIGLFLIFGQVQPRAVIDRRPAHVHLLLALEVQFGRRVETLVETVSNRIVIRWLLS